MTEVKHGMELIYRNADNCEHAEPSEPATDNDGSEEWRAWDDYQNDHPCSPDLGEPVCLLGPCGTFCPACTEEAREAGDLPRYEYVTCRLATVAQAPQ